MECNGISLQVIPPPNSIPIILDTGNVKVSWGKVFVTGIDIEDEFLRNVEIYKVLKRVRDGTDEEIPSYTFLNSVVSYLSEYIADNLPSSIFNVKTKGVVCQTDISVSDKPSFKSILNTKVNSSVQTETEPEADNRDELKEEVLKVQGEYSLMKKDWLKMKKTIDSTRKQLEKANLKIAESKKSKKKETTSEVFTEMIKKHDFNYIDLCYIMLNARVEETIKTIVIWQLFYMRSLSREDMKLKGVKKVANFYDFWGMIMVPVLEKFKQTQIKELVEEWKVMYNVITKEGARVDISPDALNIMFWCLCHRFKHRCQVKSFYPPFFTMLSEMCLNLEKFYQMVSYWDDNRDMDTEQIVKEVVRLFMYDTHFNLLAKYSDKLNRKDIAILFDEFTPQEKTLT